MNLGQQTAAKSIPVVLASNQSTQPTQEQQAPGYEDQINGLALVEQRYSFVNITSAATTVVKNGAGFLHLLIVGTPIASATIQLYDNTAASGTKIGLITLGATLANDPPGSFRYDIVFSTGLTIVTSGATDITVSYR